MIKRSDFDGYGNELKKGDPVVCLCCAAFAVAQHSDVYENDEGFGYDGSKWCRVDCVDAAMRVPREGKRATWKTLFLSWCAKERRDGGLVSVGLDVAPGADPEEAARTAWLLATKQIPTTDVDLKELD